MSSIVSGGNKNNKKVTAESIDAWKLGGNTIGTESNKLGTLDDVDVELIRNNVNVATFSKDNILPYQRLWQYLFNSKFGVSDKGDLFLKTQSNIGNSSVLEIIYDYVNQVTNMRLGLGFNPNTGFNDTLAFDAEVYLPQQPNLSSLATDADGKIIAGSGGGGATTLTKTELDTAITNSTLTAGAFYIITDVEPTLYGGTTIVVQATSSNTLGNLSNGLFYTPKYDLYNVWENTNTYAVNDFAFWGGYVWQNLTGNAGSSVDDFTLDATNWQKISYNTTNYNVWWDIIKYDYSLDRIYYREDELGNVIDRVFYSIDNFGISAIKAFKWGFANNYNNKVTDGYLFCVNYDNSNFIYNNTLGTNAFFINILGANAFFINNTLVANASVSNNTLDAGAYFANNTLGAGASFQLNTLGANAYFNNNTLDAGANFNNNTLDANANFINNTLDAGANFSNNTLGINAYFNNNTLGIGSRFESNTLEQGSYFLNNTLDANASFNNNTLGTGASFQSNTLGTGAIFNFSTSGTITQSITSVFVNSNCNVNQNISAATIIYGDYNKTITKRQDGTLRLGYLDNTDTMVYVAVDA